MSEKVILNQLRAITSLPRAPPSRGSFFMQTAVLGGWQKLGEAYPVGGPQKTALAMVEAIEAKGTILI